MKFGVQLYPYWAYPDLAALVGYAQKAEQCRFDYIGIPEHIAFPTVHNRSMGETWWDPLILAAHLANATRRIRLIFGIIVLPQRNPVILAKQIATIDHVSNGRIDVGVAPGWLKDEFQIVGADFHKRGALTEEHIRVMKALWTGDPAAYQGTYYSFSDVSFHPKPVQQPHPPVVIGGGPKRSAHRAAVLGQGWMPYSIPQSEFEDGLDVLKHTLREQGRSLDGFAIYKHLSLFERDATVREHIRHAGSGGDRIALDGDHGRAIDYIRRCEELGVTHMTVVMPTDLASMSAELEVFSQKVISRL